MGNNEVIGILKIKSFFLVRFTFNIAISMQQLALMTKKIKPDENGNTR
jgi:hypothetical protein